MIAPKLFVSYSWSNAEHEQWVIDLATQLRESGVDVILDKWDLKEGHDAVAFMEKMVSDQEIKKVAIISDKKYAEKADGREGGVGTETQIISKRVYENQAQEKFVAVVCEKDENGKPYLPVYYSSRIYIDLSVSDKYEENFEKLIRWIFDKPLYRKPELGKMPLFLAEGNQKSLGTSAIFRRCVDAIRNQKSNALGSLEEYLETFVTNLHEFRIESPKVDFDEAVIISIEEFLPFRNDVIQVVTAIARYMPEDEFALCLHRFFESLLPYMDRPEAVSSWREADFDNYRFVVHEMFLYSVAILLKHNRIAQANMLLLQQYYLPGNSGYGKNVMVGFQAFRQYMQSLEIRNSRLKLNQLSLRANMLKDRCIGVGVEFRDLLQADFIAYVRTEVEAAKGGDLHWWPETLLYASNQRSPFEIFARACSKSYFEKIKVLLSIDSPRDLELILKSNGRSRPVPSWQHHWIDPVSLSGLKNLATLP